MRHFRGVSPIRHMHLILLAMLVSVAAWRANAQTILIEGSDRYAADFEMADAGDGVLTLRCTDGQTADYAVRNPPKIAFHAIEDDLGIVEVTYLESRGVTWQLDRRKLIVVNGCTFGEAAAFVQREQFVTTNPVDEPDVKRMVRSLTIRPGLDHPVILSTKSMKTFLAPDGGKPYARYQKLWDDEAWSVDQGSLTLKRARGKFDEISARTDLSRDNVSARTGYVRMDTPLQRSEVPDQGGSD